MLIKNGFGYSYRRCQLARRRAAKALLREKPDSGIEDRGAALVGGETGGG
jgi:hypothetical protein